MVRVNDVVANAIDKLLNSRSQHIILRQLSLRFYLGYYGCLTIGKALQQAMSTCNLKLRVHNPTREGMRPLWRNEHALHFFLWRLTYFPCFCSCCRHKYKLADSCRNITLAWCFSITGQTTEPCNIERCPIWCLRWKRCLCI